MYCICVLPQVGNKRKPWYFLTKSYWRPRPAARAAALKAVVNQENSGFKKPPAEVAALEEDVAAEEDRVKELLLQRTGRMVWVQSGCA